MEECKETKDNKEQKFSIKEGVNFAGSICSIIAFLGVTSIKIDSYEWIAVVLGVIACVLFLGLLISLFITFIVNKHSGCYLIKNKFSKYFIWLLFLLASVFISINVFILVKFGCQLLIMFIKGVVLEASF